MLKIFTGPMFSGKTSALLAALDKASIHHGRKALGKACGQKLGAQGKGLHPNYVSEQPSNLDDWALSFEEQVLIKWNQDVRSGSESVIKTHDGRIWCDNVQSVASLDDLTLPGKGRCLVAVDEAQFFGQDLLRLYERISMRSAGKSAHEVDLLMIAGLNLDFRNEPFGCILTLIEQYGAQECSEVIYLSARCFSPECTEPAHYTMRTVESQDKVLVGGDEQYQPACWKHHNIPGSWP